MESFRFQTFILILVLCQIILISAQVHVGTSCIQHADCIRYCAYSKYGAEGASCCFPEKIRVTRTDWIYTGSSTCYCCPIPNETPARNVTNEGGVYFYDKKLNPLGIPIGKKGSEICAAYLEEGRFEASGYISRISGEFCDRRCVQVMVNLKLAFEYPSVCRANRSPS